MTTYKQRSTLEREKLLQETKLLDGIFSGAWYTGLAEPGKRTVKHNNKRRRPLLKRIWNQHCVLSGGWVSWTTYDEMVLNRYITVSLFKSQPSLIRLTFIKICAVALAFFYQTHVTDVKFYISEVNVNIFKKNEAGYIVFLGYCRLKYLQRPKLCLK